MNQTSNVNFGSLKQIIEVALGYNNQSDNKQRTDAQQHLIQLRNINPAEFFTILANFLADNNMSEWHRISAGTVSGRLLSLKNDNNNRFYWDEISQNVKELIKSKTLSVLTCDTTAIMNSAAMVVSYIAGIQLPRNEWQDIIDKLGNHCSDDDLKIKRAAITTMGYICQRIKLNNNQINDRLCEQILGAVIIASKDSNEIIVTASLKALENSLPFLYKLMENDQYRNMLFEVFIKHFLGRQQIQETYHAFYQFVKISYKYLPTYKKHLVDLSEVHLQQRGQTAIWNLQLWTSIAVEYYQRKHSNQQRVGNYQQQLNFIQTVQDQILPSIMKCLLIINPKQNIEDLRQAAMKTLSSFCEASDNHKLIERITDSVTSLISNNDENVQQATTLLFSTICEYPDLDYISQVFENGFEHLFSLLMSNSKIVVSSSLIGFSKLSQFLPHVFLRSPKIVSIIDTIYGFVTVPVSQIRSLASQILSNLTQGLKQNPNPICSDPSILLTKLVSFYADNWQNFHMNNEPEMNKKIVTCIMNIVMNLQKRDVILNLIEFKIDEYYKIINMNINDKNIIIDHVLTVLHTAILVLKNAVPNDGLMQNICNLINTQIQIYKIEPQGLSVISATATTFGKQFQKRADGYWNYILHALSQTQDSALFKGALTCAGDFARVFEGAFHQKAVQVLDMLLNYINQDIDRDLKVLIIHCIGDMVLSLQQQAVNFLPQLISICDVCFSATYILMNNPNDSQYVDSLKMGLIEMYGCIMFSVNNSKRPNQRLYNHYAELSTFIVRTCDPSIHPTLQYLKICLYLIYDAAAFFFSNPQYHQLIKSVTQSNEVLQLVRTIEKYNNRSEIRELLDFVNSKRRV